jgi:hypothetical protein
MTFPKRYDAPSAPSEVVALSDHIVRRLIDGTHRALAASRQQFHRANISGVEMTGHGYDT